MAILADMAVELCANNGLSLMKNKDYRIKNQLEYVQYFSSEPTYSVMPVWAGSDQHGFMCPPNSRFFAIATRAEI